MAIARRSEPPILRTGLVCARPLASVDDHADALFVAALGDESRGYPFLRARTLFSFGRWLRRHRRSADCGAGVVGELPVGRESLGAGGAADDDRGSHGSAAGLGD